MDQQFLLSLISGIAIGGAGGYLGSLMMQKRMALAAGPLGHLALPGVALALIYGFDVSLGAFPFIILGIFLIWLLSLRTNLPMEASTAVVFAAGVAVSFLILPIAEAEEALVGNIGNVSELSTVVTVVLSVIIIFMVHKIFSRMVLINISEDLAKVEGVNVKKCNLIYLLAVALIVALGVKLVGGLLTTAIIAIPAATARNLSGTLHGYVSLSFLLGILAPIIGLLIYKATDLSSGPMIIIVSAVFFVLSLLFTKSKNTSN